MSTIDLVFEGGGAKGMVFVGALQELFQEKTPTHGRLLGTSAGAITAVTLAAGYTPEECWRRWPKRTAKTSRSSRASWATRRAFDKNAVRHSAIRKLLADLNLPFVPDFAEEKLDNWIADQLAESARGRHLFSFVERGGWYSADPFVTWLERMLNSGSSMASRGISAGCTLGEFFDATQVELTLVAADTTGRAAAAQPSHRARLPVVWAARMSMSVPLLWQEVEWRKEWGPYFAWNAEQST